jgi:hypothetical protein
MVSFVRAAVDPVTLTVGFVRKCYSNTLIKVLVVG